MRYRDLKDERDAAVARAIEAERLSMKSELDRVTAEFEHERTRLLEQVSEDVRASYLLGFNDGLDAMANDVSARLTGRAALLPRPDPPRHRAESSFPVTTFKIGGRAAVDGADQ